MWIVADYEPVAAFSLRPSNTTSSGGKSLVIPTPYAIKMALLDRMIRHWGVDYGLECFPLVRDLGIWLRAPMTVSVNRTFQKVLRPDGSKWKETIAQREYCFQTGVMTLALEVQEEKFAGELVPVLASLNYLGRKGSFIQLVGIDTRLDPPSLEEGFINLCQEVNMNSLSFGLLQRMDDMLPEASFSDINALANKASPDGGRRQYNVSLPYQLQHHGFNHTIYEYTGELP